MDDWRPVYKFCDGEIVDGLNRKHYNPKNDKDMQCICAILNADINELNRIYEKNKLLKKALECIRKRYGYSIDEFVKDLKDNGIDIKGVDLE